MTLSVLSLRPPLDTTPTVLKRLRVADFGRNFFARGQNRRDRGQGSATVVSAWNAVTKTGKQEWASMGLSDPTGHFEAVLVFPRGLREYRSTEPGAGGAACKLGASCGRFVRPGAATPSRWMRPPAKPKKASDIRFREYPSRSSPSPNACRCPSPLHRAGPVRGPRQNRFPTRPGGANGDVSLVMMLDLETEVRMKLPGRFRVSPQIAAHQGVSAVVDVQQL